MRVGFVVDSDDMMVVFVHEHLLLCRELNWTVVERMRRVGVVGVEGADDCENGCWKVMAARRTCRQDRRMWRNKTSSSAASRECAST